jgi:hypothetical protein
MKKLFILIIAFFSTLFISCEKDLYEDSIKNNSRKLKIKKVSLSDIDNNTSFKILEKVKHFKNLTKQSKSNQNNQSAKFAYNDALDLYIDYDNGKVIESEGSLFYTFPMFRKSEENLENILFIPKENGEIESYILKYDLKPEDLKTITENEISQKKIEYQPLELPNAGVNLVCIQIWDFVKDEDGVVPGDQGDLVGHNSIEDNNGGYHWVVTSEQCSWVNGGSSGTAIGGGTDGSTGGSNPGYGSVNPTPSNEPIPQFISTLIGLTSIQINFKDFIKGLSDEQQQWWQDPLNENTRKEIEEYVNQHPNNFSVFMFSNELIEQMRLNPELKLDINASAKSPAFVDMSSIDGSTPEGAKFNKVYDALKASPLFRSLFTDMFNQTPFINVKFKIEDIPQTSLNEHKNGTCKLYYNTDYSNLYNIVTIDRNHLLHKSNLDIALTIIHEYIHAYLNVKFRIPSVGQPIPFSEINNKDLKDCINTYYNGFSGNQTQHSFFSDFMVPTIREILSNVKDILVSSQQANGVQNPTNGGAFLYYPLTNPPQLGQISDTYATWNWNTFFNYFAFNGLQNCTSYPYSKPTNQNHIFNNEEDFFRYYYISVYNTIFNQ